MMVIWIALAPALFARMLTDDGETVGWAITAFGILFVPYVLFSNTVIDPLGKTQPTTPFKSRVMAAFCTATGNRNPSLLP